VSSSRHSPCEEQHSANPYIPVVILTCPTTRDMQSMT
jgi:hypothetical protein